MKQMSLSRRLSRLPIALLAWTGAAWAGTWTGTAWAQPDPPPPIISSIAILTPTVDVGKTPAVPRFAVTFTSKDTGLQDLSLELRSPSGAQHAELLLQTPLEPAGGTVEIGNGHPLSPYSEPGLWTVTRVGASNYEATGYLLTQAQIDAVLQGPGIMVVNNGPVDITKPVMHAGRIVTPTISRENPTGSGEIKIAIDASDDLSGISSLRVLSHAGTDPEFGYVELFNNYPSLGLHGPYGVSTYAPQWAAGTYVLIRITLCDNARNCRVITDPATIAALFNNQPSFTITP